MSIQPKFGFILYYVDDIEAAKAFYVDVLGLKVERYHPTFVQFENFAIASDEAMNASREPEVYWVVPDAEAALAELGRKAAITHAPAADAVWQSLCRQRPRRACALPA